MCTLHGPQQAGLTRESQDEAEERRRMEQEVVRRAAAAAEADVAEAKAAIGQRLVQGEAERTEGGDVAQEKGRPAGAAPE